MKAKLLIVLLLPIFLFDISIAQNLPDSSQSVALVSLLQKYPGNFSSHWNDRIGTPDVITFTNPVAFAKDQKNSAINFLDEVSGMLKQRAKDDNLVLTKQNIDDKGIGHFLFNQEYEGIPVVGGELGITVLPNNCIQLALGSFVKNITTTTTPSIKFLQALQTALQNQPPNITLKDSLTLYRLVIFPHDSVNYLSWELRVPTNNIAEQWIYYIDALTGKIIDYHSLGCTGVQVDLALLPRKMSFYQNAKNKKSKNLANVPTANVYPSSPLDGGYVPVILYDLDGSGYLEGTYAYIINEATIPARAYSPQEDFSYDPSVTQFDEANLYYQVDFFRTHYWNQMGFNGFQQITAYCHYTFSDGPNSNENNGIIYFSGYDAAFPSYRSFAQEAKFIYHEYTHAVEHYYVNFPYQEDQECCAIDEGNADYFASTFAVTLNYYSNPTTIGHWADYGHPEFWRDILNPRITTYSEYNDPNYWISKHISPFLEPHYGGEFWSACLWDLRNAFGNWTSDRDIYYALSPSLPPTSSFYQYEQSIITADINHFNGVNAEEIRHLFFSLRGIGFDSLGLSISGPVYLNSKQWGTYTANITGGSGSVTYQWYNSDDGGATWYTDGTAQTQSLMMFNSDFIVRCDVHDTQTGENKSTNMTVHYGSPPPKIGTALNNSVPLIFKLEQNFPDPFNPSTIIHYEIPNDGLVMLKIYDELGREVKTLVNQYQSKGRYDINFNAENLASGIYFYQLHASTNSASNFISTKKMLLLK